MRHALLPLSILPAASLLTACGQAGAPNGVLRATSLAGAEAGAIISSNAARAAAPAVDVALPALDLAYAEPDPPASPEEEEAAEARTQAAEAPSPGYSVDDRMPYGVVVVSRTATTATIAWRTNVPTRGLIEFAKSRDFKGNKVFRIHPQGFTDRVVDDVAKTDHKYTLTGLSRYTSYTFKVTAVTPLGLKFAEKERSFRTKFWALR